MTMGYLADLSDNYILFMVTPDISVSFPDMPRTRPSEAGTPNIALMLQDKSELYQYDRILPLFLPTRRARPIQPGRLDELV
jgi:hypothetical protein